MKPHLIKAERYSAWYCLDGRWQGWGKTPQQAYQAWRTRDREHSSVHNRPTPLQLRLRDAAKWKHAIAVVRSV